MRHVPIIRGTPFGKRIFPIPLEEADRLVQEGRAVVLNRGLYAEVAASESVDGELGKNEPEVSGVVASTAAGSDDAPSELYQTRVMEATTPRRRRGRPPKVRP